MTSVPRRGYLDWVRGFAVLLMIEAHATDAWTRLTDKTTAAYRDATILGGFAAPLFLFLAGLAVVLSATRHEERTGSRATATEAVVRRGLEIFILAFLFRVQAFIVSPGNHLIALFRVDILNVMGPAMAAGGLVWALSRRAALRLALFASVAVALAMLAPVVRTAAVVDALPSWLQWYVRPAGELTVFTLFPWAGFVFAGGAAGVPIAALRPGPDERRVHVALAGVGVALIVLGFVTAARPSIYASSSFWTSSPTWFAIRAGVVILAVAGAYALETQCDRLVLKSTGVHARALDAFVTWWRAPLETIGRNSLFIYWIHVELVYGYASWFWHHRLPLWGTSLAYVAFCVLMYQAVGWRDRVVYSWKARHQEPISVPHGEAVA